MEFGLQFTKILVDQDFVLEVSMEYWDLVSGTIRLPDTQSFDDAMIDKQMQMFLMPQVWSVTIELRIYS